MQQQGPDLESDRFNDFRIVQDLFSSLPSSLFTAKCPNHVHPHPATISNGICFHEPDVVRHAECSSPVSVSLTATTTTTKTRTTTITTTAAATTTTTTAKARATATHVLHASVNFEHIPRYIIIN